MRLRRIAFQPFCHLVEIRNADVDYLLLRQPSELFQRAYLLDLKIAGHKYSVIVVGPEHAVARDFARRMQHVDIAVYVLAALPLIDIKPRSCGEQDGRAQEVQLGKALVSVTDELAVQMLVAAGQRRIVLGLGHVGNVNTSSAQLAADRLENIPVALIVRKDDKRQLFLRDLRAPFRR